MPNTTVQANGEAMPIDAILSIARALAEGEREREAFEEKARDEESVRRLVYEMPIENLIDRTSDLRDMLSHHKAVSLSGAAVQVAEIVSRVDSLCESIPENAWDHRSTSEYRAFLRLAFSVLDLLETLADEKVGALVYESYSNQHLNPWKTPDELFALRGLADEVQA